MDARILSVRQPWSWLIVAGYKDVENRSWSTNYRGRLFIHAGLQVDYEAWETVEEKHRIPMPDELDIGGIVGYVDLLGVEDRFNSRWHNKDCKAWVLGNAREVPIIECKGQQGLFRPNRSLALQLEPYM